MGPEIRLDGDALRHNVAAFAALGAPVAAVVKSDGYGWGARRLARELDPHVESYVVADDDELAALRPATAKPVRLLADVPAARLRRVLALGGIANVSTREGIAAAAAAGAPLVRVGILDATGWSAIPPDEAGAFAGALTATGLAVELWTHVTSPAREAAILADLAAARRVFEAAGVRVAGVDVASTASARRETAGARLRIGAGLFGGRLGSPVATRCAIAVRAPVVRRYRAGEARWAGYGDRPVPVGRPLAVLRCGYGDGFPQELADSADILAVGMQYTTRALGTGDPSLLIGPEDDLDALAARARRSVHQLVVGLAR